MQDTKGIELQKCTYITLLLPRLVKSEAAAGLPRNRNFYLFTILWRDPGPFLLHMRQWSSLWALSQLKGIIVSNTSTQKSTLSRVPAVAVLAGFGAALLTVVSVMTGQSAAFAAEAPVGLGTAGSYSVLGGQTVTNTGPSQLNADLGVSPGSAITGFPPGIAGGSVNAGNAEAARAQTDVVAAYDDAASRNPTESVSGDLVGRTMGPGVYNSTGPLALGGTLTLDGQGDPNAVFIFQAASSLITASASDINLIGGARACNVFWQVGSSATLGTQSSFTGTILALTSITATTNTVVEGRALARNGTVALDNNTVTAPNCSQEPIPSAPAPAPVPTESAPVPTESAPAPTESAPVPTESAPAPTESAPVPTASAPAPIPVPTESAPVPAPTASAPAPIPAPTEAAAVPLPTATEPAAATPGSPSDHEAPEGTNRGINIDSAGSVASPSVISVVAGIAAAALAVVAGVFAVGRLASRKN